MQENRSLEFVGMFDIKTFKSRIFFHILINFKYF